MEYQLRSYQIQAERLDTFVQAWRGGVYRLREALGFTIVGAWVLADSRELVWVLGYDGPEGFGTAAAAYYRSPERAALDPDPAPYIEHAEERFMTAVLANSPPT